MDVDRKLLAGIQEYQQQRYGESERVATEILQVDADNARALNLLGMSLHRQGRTDAGADLVARAAALHPDYAPARTNLATIHWENGDREAALRVINEAISQVPDAADVYRIKALFLLEMGQYGDCAQCLRKYVALNPGSPEAHTTLGVALSQLGRFEEALASHDKAIALDPACAAALLNRGNALHSLARLEDAVASYDRAIAVKSDYAEAFANRGNVLRELARPNEALESYSRAIAIKPGYPEALNGCGSVLCDLRRYEEALESCDRALAITSDDPDAWNLRGNVLLDLKRHGDALESYDHALAIKPDHHYALHNRGYLLAELKRHEEAAQCYERLLGLAPGFPFLKGELLHQKMLCCDWRQFDALAESTGRDVRAGRKSAEPFGYQAVSRSEQDLKRCAEIYTGDKFPAAETPMWAGERYGNARIRIGYLSGEFRQQATAVLITELFELHDKSRFELFAFDNGWDDASELRGRIKRAFHEIVDISRLADVEAAAAIRQRKIDILVNLNGYFGRGRQGVFSYKPSPVQVNYLGFPGTIGADYIDYIIADRHVIPPGHQAHYTEQVVYLPDTYQVNDSKRKISDDMPARAAAKLPERGFVFCCFNNNYKITPDMFAVWMRLLCRVEGSVLWLLEDNAAASSNLRREAESRGVASERIVFAKRVRLDQHLARHGLADLFLDTLPYNAHTTASDALWTGLPLLTCQGTTFPGRVAASLLNAVGLPELITHGVQEYEARALELAAAPGRLAEIRTKLVRNRASWPLFNAERFRRHLESAYMTMWNRQVRGEAPAGFAVQPCEAAVKRSGRD